MAKASVNLKFDQATIKAMIKYFEKLLSQKFPLEIKKRYESPNALDALQEAAREITEQLIYDAWPDPGNRTYDLLNSVVAVAGGSKGATAQINLLSDPEVATAKYYPTMSYMAFFEKPEDYHTFIHPRGIASNPANYRPFFDTWVKLVQKHSEKLAIEAINTALDNLMPNQLKSVSPTP